MMGSSDKPVKGKQRIAVFASGTGSNAQRIIDHFNSADKGANVALVVSNNPAAGVLKIAEKENIPSLIIDRKKFYDDGYTPELKNFHIDFIVLAGFMWKVPVQLIMAYPNKMINIHPALLPKYGGKNMYGSFVHEAVLNAGETESGITIHYVDEIYDHGKIIFQAKCRVDKDDTAVTLTEKIHTLEHQHYPSIIEKLVTAGDT